MSRSSARRGQVEPTAALVAVLAVGAGLSLYAGAVEDAPLNDDRDVAPVALDSVRDAASTAGVLDPGELAGAVRRETPRGYRLNATLAAGGRRWTAGPPRPASGTDRASVRTSVGLGPGRVRPGQLRVVVW
ncbi:MAG: hypothetical protein ABEH47_05165 [Haloferacaceae archaeon]